MSRVISGASRHGRCSTTATVTAFEAGWASVTGLGTLYAWTAAVAPMERAVRHSNCAQGCDCRSGSTA
ncbi:hypothetical protein LP417_23735 [Polaromonas sp. P1-6]|nr:hypothetical protein LP417_23735 [Polaromonas sp. P1-6]